MFSFMQKSILFEKIKFFILLGFLIFIYFYNTFYNAGSRDNKNFEKNNYYENITEIIFNKEKLIDFYEDYKNSRNHNSNQDLLSSDKRLFGYFFVFIVLIFLLLSFLVREEESIVINKADFWSLLIIYHILQSFLQFISLKIFFPFLVDFISYQDILFKISLLKAILLFFTLFLAPLSLLIILRFCIFCFYKNFIIFIKKNKKQIFFIFVSCFFVFLIFLSIFKFVKVDNINNLDILVIYIIYGRFYELVIGFICLVLIVPLVEELLFRVYLINYLRGMFGVTGSLFFSSFIFSIIHFQTLISSLIIFLIGLILGGLYLLTKRVESSYFFHSIYNMFIFLYCIYWG